MFCKAVLTMQGYATSQKCCQIYQIITHPADMQTSEYCSSGYKGNLKVYFNFVCYAYDNVSQSTVAMCEVGRKYVS